MIETGSPTDGCVESVSHLHVLYASHVDRAKWNTSRRFTVFKQQPPLLLCVIIIQCLRCQFLLQQCTPHGKKQHVT